ncbi:MAG: Ig domain-containing protein, partial [Rhodanobacter sp.]
MGLSPNDPNNPYNNLSSEAPDVDLFIGRRFTPPGLGNPPLGSTWYSIGCLGFAFSSVSQQDADLLAQQQAVLCTSTEWPEVVTQNPNPNLPPTVTPRPVFFSQPASCDFTCPDGSIFTYTVPAGFFFAFSQAAADAMAASFACNQVVANRSCFGPPPQARVCLDALYDSSIAVASANLPITFTIQSGSLPPGIVEAQTPDTYLLSGVPTVPGDYTFLLRATDSTSGFIEKQISISVFGIVNTSPMPEATVGTPYSETLIYAGTPVGAVVYSIISGALPDGLSLNSSTGEISGTPTTEESAGFAVQITDSEMSCVKQFVLEVVGAASGCSIFSSIVWEAPTYNTSNGGTAEVTVVGASFSGSTTGPIHPDASQGELQVFGDFEYTGAEIECCVIIDAGTGGTGGGSGYVEITHDGNVLINVDFDVDGPGSYPFTIPVTPVAVTI